MITVNQETFNKVAEQAKAKSLHSIRWTNAIKKASDVVNNLEMPFIWWNTTEQSLLISSENSSNIYEIKADGVCQCQAYTNGNPCWHRALWRLMARYEEEQKAVALATVITKPRYNESEKSRIELEALELFVAG